VEKKKGEEERESLSEEHNPTAEGLCRMEGKLLICII
jgi:hypothetical protein